ncbi:MAG: hypothetical protein ABSG32_32050 [Terriglobia bacterium]|jgi:hypothetical protein
MEAIESASLPDRFHFAEEACRGQLLIAGDRAVAQLLSGREYGVRLPSRIPIRFPHLEAAFGLALDWRRLQAGSLDHATLAMSERPDILQRNGSHGSSRGENRQFVRIEAARRRLAR